LDCSRHYNYWFGYIADRRQVGTFYGGRIDLLGINSEGNLVILELKKDKTPRNVVAQTLDYASWVKDLTYLEIEAIAFKYLNKNLNVAFSERFQTDLPQELNKEHSIVIIASELDHASERIVRYLSSEHKLNINCIFFEFFKDGNQEFLGRSWLMDLKLWKNNFRQEALVVIFNVGDGEHSGKTAGNLDSWVLDKERNLEKQWKD
jgi:hypothetical protein